MRARGSFGEHKSRGKFTSFSCAVGRAGQWTFLKVLFLAAVHYYVSLNKGKPVACGTKSAQNQHWRRPHRDRPHKLVKIFIVQRRDRTVGDAAKGTVSKLTSVKRSEKIQEEFLTHRINTNI